MPTQKLILYNLFFFFVFLYTSSGKAETASPFLTHDINPLVMIYGLPLVTPAKIIAADETRLSTSLNISNTVHNETFTNESMVINESLIVDAETYQLNLLFEYGLSENWVFGFKLPVVAHNSGFMDASIDRFHEIFGFPEHIRPKTPRDLFQIKYEYNGVTMIDLQQRTAGVGDVSLQLGYQAKSSNDFHLSYWGSLKLPTGDAQKLTGSGGTDLALWLSADKGFKNDRWVFANMGLMFISDSDLFQATQKDHIFFGSMGFQIHPWKPILLKAQLESHSAFYNSKADFLDAALQISFGGTILLKSSSLDLVITEDIKTQSAPDVTFQLNWTFLY